MRAGEFDDLAKWCASVQQGRSPVHDVDDRSIAGLTQSTPVDRTAAVLGTIHAER